MNVNLNIGGLRVNTAAEGATSTSKAGGQDQGQAIDVTKQEEVRHDLVDGDYQIIVHVIEARDLNPVDVENGTADPVVVAKLSFPSSVVEARQNTIRKVNTLNPVFDHTMIFREKSVPAEEAKLAILKLSVRDSNIASRDTVIGEFDFNISAIYKRKNHQYFHQWVALGDPSGVDKNPAGYLKVNITCLINDDEMAVSTESQVQGEKLGVKYGMTQFDDILLAPWVIQGSNSICLEVIRGEGFTPLDFSQFFGLGGVDPYVQLQFGNETPTVSSYIPGNREPVWNQQLEVPVKWPTMLDTITVSVWDHDHINTDDAIGAMKFSYKDLTTTFPHQIGPPITDLIPNWNNLYGSPPEAWSQGVGAFATAYAMNHGGLNGTFFRGRMLMRLWCRMGGPGIDRERRSYDLPIDSTVTIAFKDVVTDTKSDDTRKFVAETKECGHFDPLLLGEMVYKEFTETRYQSRIDVYEVSDMDVANTGPLFGTPVSVKVRVGAVEVETKKQKVAEGRAAFFESLDMSGDKELHFPEIKKKSETQFPDVFIYLMRDGKHIAYIRYKGYELYEASKKKISSKDFVPKWVPFIEEPCHDFFGPGEIPGFLLFNIILGRPDDVEKAGRGGKLIQPIETKYQLRFHLYMAKFLPAKDENGLSDPYVLVKYYGKTLKSSVKAETCNPCWYETVTDTVAVPEPLDLAPPVTGLVYDEDTFSKDDLIGRFSMPLTDAMLKTTAVAEPKWYDLTFEKPGDCSGKVLCSVSLVPEDKVDKVPLPDLRPETVNATVEITAVGLRDMKPVPMLGALGDKLGLDIGLPLMSPFVEFDMGDADTRSVTKESSIPSSTNPNFLERYEVKMKLPKNPLFCPTMTLRVRDTKSVGGFVIGQPLVATGTVAIDQLCPWVKGFKEPKSPLIDLAKKYMAEGESIDAAYHKGSKGFFTASLTAMKKMGDRIADFMDDGELDTPKFMLGRKIVDDELEQKYAYPSPISEYALYRGCDGFLSAETMCGKFKGYVRVLQDGIVGANMLPMDLKEVFMEKKLMVRLYLLKAYNLPPMDLNGSCDSYPVVSMGSDTFEDKDAMVEQHLNPNYWSSYEFQATLPGNGECKIQIWDHDKLGMDDLVGETFIDIENRWFNQEWRAHDLKPAERRTLKLPGSSMSQGKIQLWVDILTPQEAKQNPMIDIKPPAPEEFEVRLVIWETKDVPMKTKDGETKLDMKVNVNFIGYEFIQSEGGTGQMNNRWDYALSYTEMVGMMNKQIEKAGHLAQDALIKYKNELGLAANPGYDKETDVHWWVKDGRGLFNYRMVWPCKYNCDMIEDKQMRLQFRVYDHDIATKDDMIGEAQIDLQPVLKAAFVHKERNTLLRIAEPWRIQDMLTSWKAFLFLRKDGHKVGELIVSLDVYGHLVAMIKPSGEGRSDPNQFPTLSEPRRRNWDEPPMYQGTGCCGFGMSGQGNVGV